MLEQRTDLALEKHELNCNNRVDDGIIVDEEIINDIKISRIVIENESASEKANMKTGKYITIDVGEIWNKDNTHLNNCVEIIKKELLEMIDIAYNKCLVVGLGNRRILCDSIGPQIIDNIIVTSHIKLLNKEMFDDLNLLDVSALVPGVLGDTGMESVDIIKSVISKCKPDLIIIIDALASRNIDRLAKTIQITNSGIAPGSGINNNRKELSLESIGVPVVCIGVPTVVDAITLVINSLENIVYNDISTVEINLKNKENFFVSLKDTDIIINKMVKLLSVSINYALQNQMKIEDIDSLLN